MSENISLRIPEKNLEDNFRLGDFQLDFKDIQRLLLYTLARPKELRFSDNGFQVTLDNNEIKSYKIERNPETGKISRVTNTVDNQMLNIDWGAR